MDINPDFSDLLKSLNRANARYIIVGAQAVIYHADPRYTKDMDVWVEATPENAERVYSALKAFGAPLAGLTTADLSNPNMVYRMGIEPNCIDIMMGIDGATFASAWRNRVRGAYGQVPASILGINDLIRAKRAAGRPQDLLDVTRLLKAKRLRGRRRRPKRGES